MEDYLFSNLKKFTQDLDDQSLQKMVKYYMDMTSPEQIKAELKSMLGKGSGQFIKDFISRKFSIQYTISKHTNKLELGKLGPALQSRKQCDCMGTNHDVICNCLACGKVICEAEGVGPCYFCGHQVDPSGKIPVTVDLQEAERQRDILVERQINQEENKIIDESLDWFDITENQ